MAGGVTVRVLDGDTVLVRGAEALGSLASGSPVWIDLVEPDQATLETVGRHFGLHPLSLEDCLHVPQRPKIELFDDHLFLIWIVPGIEQASDATEIDAFLGESWLVTVHAASLSAIDHAAQDARELLVRGPDRLLHAILDGLVDGVFESLDRLGESLDALEDEVLQPAGSSPEYLRRIHDLRRRLLELHRTLAPERDIIRSVVREREIAGSDAYRYYSDVGDHLARVEDELDVLRNVAADLIDIHLSAVGNRTNEIMKRLTVVATIFMPLTLITGIYGMNFRAFPELSWRFGYPGVVIVMVLIAAAMLVYFRRRGWW